MSAAFDRLAFHYDWMEKALAGRKLEQCRSAFWSEVPRPGNALLAGEGHGRYLSALLRRFPEAQVTCVESSPRMLDVARARLARESLKTSGVTFISQDILTWTPDSLHDLIACHFFLDCFTQEQLGVLIPKLARCAAPSAALLISDFQAPASGPAHFRARAILWLMYRFFRIATSLPASRLAPPAPILTKHGFVRARHREFDWGLLYADLWRSPSPPSPASS